MRMRNLSTVLMMLLVLLFSACSKNSNVEVAQIFPPTNIKTLSGLSEIAFEWDANYDPNVTGFKVYRRNMAYEANLSLVATINSHLSTHWADSKLSPNSNYEYGFTSFNKQTQSEMILIQASTTQPVDAPPFVQAITSLPGAIKILWRPHPDHRVGSYLVLRNKLSTQNWELIATIKGRLNAEYIDASHKPSEHYRYKVVAKTFDGTLSAESAIVSATTKQLPPPVQSLVASKNAPKKVILTWDAPFYQDFSHFAVYIKGSKILPYLSPVANTAEKIYEHEVSKDGSSYYYAVSMVDKDGLESPKEEVLGQSLEAPKAPTFTQCLKREDGIHLSWTNPDSRAVRYRVVRSDGLEYTDIIDQSMIDTQVDPNSAYSYYVFAADEYGLESKNSIKAVAQ